MGFPICAIDNKGEGVVYKEKNTGGCMMLGMQPKGYPGGGYGSLV